MPAKLSQQAEKLDSQLIWFRSLILVLFILALSRHFALPAYRIGLHFGSWILSSLIGIGSGFAIVGLQWLVLQIFPTNNLSGYSPNQKSTAYYALSALPGVFAEELWIAFCLVTLRQSNHSLLVSVGLTAVVFGVVHLHYRLGGAIAVFFYGIMSASLFLWQGSLFCTCLFHYIGNIGSFHWAHRHGDSPGLPV